MRTNNVSIITIIIKMWIKKHTSELLQITMLTSTKAKEMAKKYEVFPYLNVFGFKVKGYIVEKSS